MSPADVAENLQRVFAPLFGTALKQRVLQSPGTAMVVLDLPVPGWLPPFFQEDKQTWAFAGDYPTNARTVLAESGAGFSEDKVLLTLCRKLENDPRLLAGKQDRNVQIGQRGVERRRPEVVADRDAECEAVRSKNSHPAHRSACAPLQISVSRKDLIVSAQDFAAGVDNRRLNDWSG